MVRLSHNRLLSSLMLAGYVLAWLAAAVHDHGDHHCADGCCAAHHNDDVRAGDSSACRHAHKGCRHAAHCRHRPAKRIAVKVASGPRPEPAAGTVCAACQFLAQPLAAAERCAPPARASLALRAEAAAERPMPCREPVSFSARGPPGGA